MTAMLTFAFSSLPFGQALLSKPHLYAAFWALLMAYTMLRFMESRSRLDLFLSILCAVGQQRL